MRSNMTHALCPDESAAYMNLEQVQQGAKAVQQATESLAPEKQVSLMAPMTHVIVPFSHRVPKCPFHTVLGVVRHQGCG